MGCDLRRVVVLFGPDGTGKSSVADELVERLPGSVRRMHHRPQLLRRPSAGDVPVTDPHRDPPRPRGQSILKLLLVYLDYLGGWIVLVIPHLLRGGWVVVERGWWDMEVDPRRYRLAVPGRLIRLLGHLQPRPASLFVLIGDADVIHARKPELERDELEAQMGRWRAVGIREGARLVDVTVPLSEVVDSICSNLGVPGEKPTDPDGEPGRP